MTINLVGYGQMGRMLEAAALKRGHRIGGAVDPFYMEGKTVSGAPVFKGLEEIQGGDVALEFTRPDTALANITALLSRHIPVVAGTTGWYDGLDEAAAAAEKAGTGLLWSSNYSLGVHLFYRIASYAAALADPLTDYDVAGLEVHHNRKADSPSGTAKTLAGLVLAAMSRKDAVVYDKIDRRPEGGEIHFASLRLGSAPGQHSLYFDSPADTIEITHTARNREGLATGAILAAEWLIRCEGPGKSAGEPRRGVFTMDDVLKGLWDFDREGSGV
jgi:4-hydroxy-tetrahydrodipicolinate reductase